jgi:hypothetical protein
MDNCSIEGGKGSALVLVYIVTLALGCLLTTVQFLARAAVLMSSWTYLVTSSFPCYVIIILHCVQDVEEIYFSL